MNEEQYNDAKNSNEGSVFFHWLADAESLRFECKLGNKKAAKASSRPFVLLRGFLSS